MLPLASIRRHSSAQDTLCRSSVVRIQSSFDTPIFAVMSWKSAEIRSVKDLWVEPGVARRLLDLLAVLVGAGQEEHVEAVQPLEARHHVGRDRGVGVADMRRAVHVIDRRGDVEPLCSWHISAEHPEAGDDRLALVQVEPLRLVLQPRQRVPHVAPSIKRTQRDEPRLLSGRPGRAPRRAPPRRCRRAAGP